MTIDIGGAGDFLATHGRVLDRRRFEALVGDGDVDAVLAAVDGYRNADGGYGWGLEPDLRAPDSQPGGALHAFEVFPDAPVGKIFTDAARSLTPQYQGPKAGDVRTAIGDGLTRVEQGKQRPDAAWQRVLKDVSRLAS